MKSMVKTTIKAAAVAIIAGVSLFSHGGARIVKKKWGLAGFDSHPVYIISALYTLYLRLLH